MLKKAALFVLTAAVAAFAPLGGADAPRPGQLRDYPGDYGAMIAICSDIDGATPAEFEKAHRFLNTLEPTENGPGLGLDVADSFWMFNFSDIGAVSDHLSGGDNEVMSYFWQDGVVKHAAAITKYYHCGWIDTIHSYGDFSMADPTRTPFTAELARRSLDAMREAGISPSVWTNHGNKSNAQNIRGSRRSALAYQKGGDPSSEYYHADAALAAGIRFIWFSDPGGRFGSKTPLYAVTLEDGARVWGFRRYTGSSTPLGHKYSWSVYNLHKQLSRARLDGLVSARRAVVVAQHLGGGADPWPFPAEAMDALRLLADYQRRGLILVARTSRLLEYIRVRDYLEYTYSSESGSEIIDVISVNDPVIGASAPQAEQLRGITFYAQSPARAAVRINGADVPERLLQRGADTVGFKWHDPDYTDYTKPG